MMSSVLGIVLLVSTVVATTPYSCPACNTSHGHCRRGECICDIGYSGADCEVSPANCPNQCSNHGTCGTSGCVCNAGWMGPDCATANPYSCAAFSLCNGHGHCRRGECACDAGWGGVDCRTPSAPPTCPNNCTGHGTCSAQGSCICAPQWKGAQCDAAVPCLSHTVEHGNPSSSTLWFADACPGSPVMCSGAGHCRRGECGAPTDIWKVPTLEVLWPRLSRARPSIL
ncbi:putative tenascin [Paratrimastix pyriformis]|uniref:Tenascin n=1 Tax=Paratrimastix pyriformis TaxID=342808 RepID=A0ABQ8UM29_9EUKA|nr:putative tenascin [Paratrimastix pyriformis]